MEKNIYFGTIISIASDFLLILAVLALLPYRCIVLLLARIFKPNLRSFVTGMSQIFCSPQIGKYTDIRDCLEVLIVEGNVDVEDLRQNFKKRVILHRNTKGNFIFQRFKHTMSDFLGYKFWEEDQDFDLGYHIQTFPVSEGPVNENWLRQNLHNLTSWPFEAKRSPWFVLLIQNYENNKTLIFMRHHHALGDGFSLMGVFRLMMEPKQEIPNLQNPKSFRKILSKIAKIPLDSAVARDVVVPELPELQKNISFEHDVSFTRSYKIGEFRKIMKTHEVSFQTVVFAAVTFAIEQVLRNEGVPIPKFLLFCHALKSIWREEGMANDFYPGIIKLPISSPTFKQRLLDTETATKETYMSSFSVGQFYRVKAATLLPTILRSLSFMSIFHRTTLFLSLLPAMGKLNFLGREVTECFALCGKCPMDLGIFCTGAPNQVRIAVTTRKHFPGNVQEFREGIELAMAQMMH